MAGQHAFLSEITFVGTMHILSSVASRLMRKVCKNDGHNVLILGGGVIGGAILHNGCEGIGN